MEVSGKRGDLANGDIKIMLLCEKFIIKSSVNNYWRKKKTSQLKSRENIKLLLQERNKLFVFL